MTTVEAPQVVSATHGGLTYPWHYARTADELHDIMDKLLGEVDGHVLFYAWDRPAGGEDTGKPGDYPPQQLKIVYRDGFGAAHYLNADPDNEPVGMWLSHADVPRPDVAPPVYDPWNPEYFTVPPEAVLPMDRLRELATEYASTGRRPENVRWTPVDFV